MSNERREGTGRQPISTSYLPGADFIRSVAMLAVFTVHAIQVLLEAHPEWLMNFCRFGTDLFLLLSGCLTYRSVIVKDVGYGAFLLRRFRRTYPVFLCILGAYLLILYPLAPEHSRLPADAVAALKVIIANAAIVPLVTGISPIITVSWTLGYIWCFYLIIYPVIRLTEGRRLAVRVAVWGCLTLCVYLGWGRPALLPLGVLLSEAIDHLSPPVWMLSLTLGFGVRSLHVSWMPPDLRFPIAAVAGFVFCWWMLTQVASGRIAGLISRISYSFYLTHGPAILLISAVRMLPALRIPCALITAFALAGLTYWLVERHFSPLRCRRPSGALLVVEASESPVTAPALVRLH